MISILFIFLSLFSIFILTSLIFYILIQKKIKFLTACKLVSVAFALNRLLFTASGFIASSYLFQKKKDLSFSEILGAFFVMELLGVLPWLSLGVYFGVSLSLRIPWIFWVFLFFLLFFLIFRYRYLRDNFSKIKRYFVELSKNIFKVIPLIIFNQFLYVFYYYFLFSLFGFSLHFMQIIKIISLSFSLGYLSLAPAGLGLKDASLVFLLVKEGVSLNNSILCAFLDRLLITGFWTLMGIFLGVNVIKKAVKDRINYFKQRITLRNR